MFNRKLYVFWVFISLSFFSCKLFENDVADFMEKYTETAAIEAQEFHVLTYSDTKDNLCIPSEDDVEISFFMRNPKKYNLVPSVEFKLLGSEFSRTAVDINQTDPQTIILSLPQQFLIPADEGQNITAEI